MDDRQLWNYGTTRLAGLRTSLSPEAGAELTRLLNGCRQAKEALAAVSASIDAASICRDCKGQCCLNGKYRMSALDYLASLADVPVEADFSRKPVCPYGSEDGCSMEPGLRPADCVLFVCEEIDRKLSEQARIKLAELEQGLRRGIAETSRLIGLEPGIPLLLWAERSMLNSNNKTKVLLDGNYS